MYCQQYKISSIYQQKMLNTTSIVESTSGLKKKYQESMVVQFKMLDLLYNCKSIALPALPLWSGFMQMVFGINDSFERSSVVFLPMIPFPPTNLTCVYSTLKFVEEIAGTKGDQFALLTKLFGGKHYKYCSHPNQI